MPRSAERKSECRWVARGSRRQRQRRASATNGDERCAWESASRTNRKRGGQQKQRAVLAGWRRGVDVGVQAQGGGGLSPKAATQALKAPGLHSGLVALVEASARQA